jgi:hypothetical protein
MEAINFFAAGLIRTGKAVCCCPETLAEKSAGQKSAKEAGSKLKLISY